MLGLGAGLCIRATIFGLGLWELFARSLATGLNLKV